LIQIEHLTKRFGHFTAVDDITLTVREGEVYAFLGPNGSGKTTTLKSIVGLNVPTSGRILVNHRDVRSHQKETRRLISYLPQRVVFPENQTAREIIAFYGRMRKLPRSSADDAMTRVRFNGFTDKLVSDFSGGMIQRLGLAVIALPDAPILLLDEPTANLDPQGVKRFREFIMSQRALGKTILFSTHLLDEAEQIADRVGIFVSGRLAAEESIESLKRTYLAAQTLEDFYLHYVGNRDDA
jgi:ABC-type multidrug transport system ATPase subunit